MRGRGTRAFAFGGGNKGGSFVVDRRKHLLYKSGKSEKILNFLPTEGMGF